MIVLALLYCLHNKTDKNSLLKRSVQFQALLSIIFAAKTPDFIGSDRVALRQECTMHFKYEQSWVFPNWGMCDYKITRTASFIIKTDKQNNEKAVDTRTNKSALLSNLPTSKHTLGFVICKINTVVGAVLKSHFGKRQGEGFLRSPPQICSKKQLLYSKMHDYNDLKMNYKCSDE